MTDGDERRATTARSDRSNRFKLSVTVGADTESAALLPPRRKLASTIGSDISATIIKSLFAESRVACIFQSKETSTDAETDNNQSQSEAATATTAAEFANDSVSELFETGSPIFAASGHSICCAIGSSIFLFDALEICHFATINLGSFYRFRTEHTATVCAFNRDASFLAIGDIQSVLHFIYVETSNRVLSLNLSTFVPSNSQTSPINILETAILNQDANLSSVVQKSISFTVLNLAGSSASALTNVSCVLGWNEDFSTQICGAILIAGSGKFPISIWNRTSFDSQPKLIDSISAYLSSDIIQAEYDPSEKYLILLDKTCILSVWDSKRLIMLRRYQKEKKIINFVVTPAQTKNEISRIRDINIVALIDSEDGKDYRFIEIIHLPTFTVLHRIQVSSDSWLIKQDLKVLQTGDFLNEKHTIGSDRIYFAERMKASDGTWSLHLRCILETNPVDKVQLLIKSGDFDDAKECATNFGLDMEFVLKSKLAHYVSQASAEKSDVEDLICDLNAIKVSFIIFALNRIVSNETPANNKDDAFCLEFCLKIRLPSSLMTYKLLLYARGRGGNDSFNSTLDDLAALIHQALNRLGTFELLIMHDSVLEGNGAFLNLKVGDMNPSQSQFDPDMWQRFRTMNIVDELQNRASREDLDGLILIWTRHSSDQDLFNHLMDILHEIPEICSLNCLISWFENDIIPKIQSAELYISVADWIRQRARVIEAHQGAPHEALSLVSLLEATERFKSAEGIKEYLIRKPVTPANYVSATISVAQKSNVSSFGFNIWDGRQDLLDLKLNLEDLAYLWDIQNFKVVLAEYCQSDPSSISLDLLDRVPSFELLPDAIENNFKPYAVRHKLNIDELLRSYCLEIMDKLVGNGKILAGGVWETRVLAIVQYISSKEIKSEIFLEMMYRTPIPWSESFGCEIEEHF
ncbi:Kinetochore-associated protein 1 [Physocladia obscura]|uniref:Kinetochore-associated protein 1 n=1 Tax=Physocladia obscura TaxID=109957 RepID=A0AAD5T718_9FUNG|nr:Kinetochore-associated protein 1 [Physocladia obscura]